MTPEEQKEVEEMREQIVEMREGMEETKKQQRRFYFEIEEMKNNRGGLELSVKRWRILAIVLFVSLAYVLGVK